MHIIPSPEHRRLVLRSCVEKLKTRGILFWTTPKDTNMKRHCNDKYFYKRGNGWILNVKDKTQTFYTEFNSEDIDKIVTSQGLEWEKSLQFHKNPARIYRKPRSR